MQLNFITASPVQKRAGSQRMKLFLFSASPVQNTTCRNLAQRQNVQEDKIKHSIGKNRHTGGTCTSLHMEINHSQASNKIRLLGSALRKGKGAGRARRLRTPGQGRARPPSQGVDAEHHRRPRAWSHAGPPPAATSGADSRPRELSPRKGRRRQRRPGRKPPHGMG